jgi:hypothetical protein
MRLNADSRVINVNKLDLIKQIENNKAKHLLEYSAAVEAYKAEAQKQITEQQAKLDKGELDIKISLTRPIDKSDEYDKLITVFNWEIKNEVELSQGEFNEYVLDETSFAKEARFSNTFYSK